MELFQTVAAPAPTQAPATLPRVAPVRKPFTLPHRAPTPIDRPKVNGAKGIIATAPSTDPAVAKVAPVDVPKTRAPPAAAINTLLSALGSACTWVNRFQLIAMV